MDNNLTRREFVQIGVGLAASLSGGRLLAATAGSTRTRRNILSSSSSADLGKYRDGVAKMMALPSTDTRSWIFQANIHGVAADGGDNPAWAQCQHGTAYFLPWHRWYVYYFEDIIRGLIGDESFALPFWPYQADSPSDDNSQTRILPEAFRQPSDTSNVLYESERDPDVNDGKPFASADAYSAGSMALPNFLSPSPPGFGGYPVGEAHEPIRFGGIENNPHNNLHMAVGGRKASGLMTDPDVAARDPIFWVHHSNIDRLWYVWNLNSRHSNPSASVQGFDLKKTFNFYDRNGKSVLRSVEDSFSLEILGYTYEEVPGEYPKESLIVGAELTRLNSTEGRTLATAPLPIALQGKRVDIKVPAVKEASSKFEALKAGQSVGRLVLLIEGVKVDKRPQASFEVYLNLPKTDTAPKSSQSPYYVGNLSFFGVKGPSEGKGHHHGGSGVDFAFDITGIAGHLAQKSEMNMDGFTVSIVPYGDGQKPGETVEVGASVTFTRATIQAF